MAYVEFEPWRKMMMQSMRFFPTYFIANGAVWFDLDSAVDGFAHMVLHDMTIKQFIYNTLNKNF